ncbi:adenosylmethionine decarboxylase [Saccharopolyspora sp. ASAGF58]|uniref:adenosylmethionine decarboxylase n=1 Tax=Saccharopolyspora sp. ASAGF58 TaxID=2719023 RepID=UPI001FF0CDBF|nr:adenosylmethionine decarboxylase [Saccharopolyspora sp. ASAGF58]
MIHAVYDITGCTMPAPDTGTLLDAMRATASQLGCTVLGELPVLFQPHGTTCVLVLAESHLTVSTWPEHQLAHLDVFTCRADIDPEHAITPILDVLGGRAIHGQRIHRTGPRSALPV